MQNSPKLLLGDRLQAGIAGAIMLYFWVGTQPFRDLSSLSAGASLNHQMILLAITGSAVVAQFLVKRNFLPGLTAICLVSGWLIISALMSSERDLALRNSVVQIIIILNAYLIIQLPKNEYIFAKILFATTSFSVLLSFFGVFMLPQLSIHQPGDLSEPMHAGLWRGHFLHKNFASSAMAVAVFCALYLHSLGWKWRAYFLGILGAIFLINTGGKTGILILPIIVMAVWTIERWPALRWVIIIGGLTAFNAVIFGVTTSQYFFELLTYWGIDATFTNRVDIWRIAIDKIPEFSAFGIGINTFWGSESNLMGGWTIENWAYTAGSAHNGYIDIIFNIGIPGLFIFAIFFILAPIRNIKIAISGNNNRDLTRFFMHLWLFGLVNACVESVFYSRSGVMWFFFIMACFGLQFQARASLARDLVSPSFGNPVAAQNG